MSVHLDVFLKRSKLPTFAAWSEAIAKESFPLSFSQSVDLTQHVGYLPAAYQGEESGFEFSVSDIAESDELPDPVRSLSPDADAVAAFRFHETHECLSATAAAAVMAHITDGVFFDPQDGRAFQGKEALAEARLTHDAAINDAQQRAVRRAEKLSPADWARAFEESLHRVHPDYRLNKEYRGRLVECIRQDVTGLYLSQNCVNIHDSYRHCFAVLFTRNTRTPALRNPFVFGSQFDHNSTISRAYNTDYRAGMKWQVAPQEWHSDYRSTLRGAQQWVGTTARSAEQFLRPLYLNRISQGAERIAALFRDGAGFIEKWEITVESLRLPVAQGMLATEFAREFGLDAHAMNWHEQLVTYFNALRLADANGCSGVALLKHRREAFNTGCNDIALASNTFLAIPPNIRNAAIFAAYVEDFVAVRAGLPNMLAMIESVKETFPQNSHEPGTERRPWWRLFL